MTTQVTSNNHRWDVPENEKGTAHKCAIFVWMCHITNFSDLPASINTSKSKTTKSNLNFSTRVSVPYQGPHLSGLGCSRLRLTKCDLSWNRLNLTFQQNNSVKIDDNQSKQIEAKTTNSEFSIHYLDLAATVNMMARFRSTQGYRRPIQRQLLYGHLAAGKAISDRTPAISEQR